MSRRNVGAASPQKPFLKWAGNKIQIIRTLQSVMAELPLSTRLIEPFVGSAAVFLNTLFQEAVLADANADLIGLYQTLQQEGEPFIDECRQLFVSANNQPDAYYQLRQEFNTTLDKRYKAALFLYLNRHCFNGLCRYNAKNGFNVPFGRYQKPYFPESEMRAFYEQSQRARFYHQDFVTTMSQAQPGDVVYCDPPYVPLSKTASFTSYSQGGFLEAQQLELAHWANTLTERGCFVIISNHNTAFTQQIYADASRILTLEVQRFISCDGGNRGKAAELVAVFTPTPQPGYLARSGIHPV